MSESIIGLYKNVLVLWDGEPFGLREAIGIILILSAAGVEIGVYAPLTRKSWCGEP